MTERSPYIYDGPLKFPTITQPSRPILSLCPDGTYKLGGSFSDLLADQSPISQAFGAALRDHYEAGLRGEQPPTSAALSKSTPNQKGE